MVHPADSTEEASADVHARSFLSPEVVGWDESDRNGFQPVDRAGLKSRFESSCRSVIKVPRFALSHHG